MNINSENLSQALNDLNSLIGRFEKNSKIEQIEIDLALSKTRQIYDLLLHLKATNVNTGSFTETPDNTFENVIKTNEKIIKTIVTPIEKEESIVEKTELVREEKTIQETSVSEPIIEFDNEEIMARKNPEPVIDVKVTRQEVVQEVKTKVVEKDILAEKFKRNEPLINEIMARMGKRDISSVLQAKPVKNIEAAIGINERFVFIRELFNGDNATYIKTIRILDSAANFNEAFNYINQTFSWDYESETVHKLLDLVRRRYITE